ncbi:PRD domain-containing protein [Companilactobacillus sp. DQM5]|uniref:PRD domain-containing protein n=1 Tax=Companilactobacillus sp. DQM5 TaxID=3463359 RepID=UPI004058979B
MLIDSVVNNNVVMSKDDDNNELILVGKGLGFKAKKGDEIEESRIQKRFYLEDQTLFSKFKSILNELSSEELIITSEIINYAQASLGKKLNESIYITLSDHIHFVIERYNKNELITNTFIWDIKRYYSTEFEIAQYAVRLINQRFKAQLDDNEAGFIAFHFINASSEMNKSIGANKLMDLVHQIVNIVSYNLNISIDMSDVNGYRFINHVKYFAQRVLEKISTDVTDQSDNELYEIVKSKYKESFIIMKKISEFLLQQYQHKMSKNDQLYFMIHIHRLITHFKKE